MGASRAILDDDVPTPTTIASTIDIEAGLDAAADLDSAAALGLSEASTADKLESHAILGVISAVCTACHVAILSAIDSSAGSDAGARATLAFLASTGGSMGVYASLTIASAMQYHGRLVLGGAPVADAMSFVSNKSVVRSLERARTEGANENWRHS